MQSMADAFIILNKKYPAYLIVFINFLSESKDEQRRNKTN